VKRLTEPPPTPRTTLHISRLSQKVFRFLSRPATVARQVVTTTPQKPHTALPSMPLLLLQTMSLSAAPISAIPTPAQILRTGIRLILPHLGQPVRIFLKSRGMIRAPASSLQLIMATIRRTVPPAFVTPHSLVRCLSRLLRGEAARAVARPALRPPAAW